MPTRPSPAFSIDSNPVGEKVAVVAGATVTGRLDDVTGTAPVTWSIINTDDSAVISDYTVTPSGGDNLQCTTTALTAGTAAEMQCTVSGGVDPTTGYPSTAMTTTVKFYVPTEGGLEVAVAGEQEDSSRIGSPTHGIIEAYNQLMRAAGMNHISFSFRSVDAASATNYAGGWYMHETNSNDFNPLISIGTADSAYGARVYLVAAAGGGLGTDTVVRVGGTSWDPDTGVRTAVDTEDITLDDDGVLGAFYQTTKLWIGQASIAKQSGPDLLCNHGFVSTWHHHHQDFVLLGFYAEWQGDGNDASTDMILFHHDPTAVWTYAAGGEAIPPILYSMQVDYNTEFEANNNEFGSYQRHDLTDTIAASSGAGVICAMVQNVSVPFGIGTIVLDMRHT